MAGILPSTPDGSLDGPLDGRSREEPGPKAGRAQTGRERARRLAEVAGPQPADAPFRADRPAFLWLLEREVLRYLKIWPYTIAGHVMSALLFVIVFGFALARRMTGVPYDQFILPGLAVQAVLTVGYINGTTSLFEARRDRYLNDVLASPLRWWELNLALLAGGMIRGALTASGVLVVAMPLTGMEVADPLVLAVAAAAILLTAGQVGVLAGAYARSLDHVYSIETLVILPLGFLSGVFYAVSRLPGPWRLASELNPVFYLVQAARIGFLGIGDVPAWLALAVSCGLAVTLSAWSVLVFRSAALLKPLCLATRAYSTLTI
jgi:ABC-2 type transport system permease protein